MTNLRTNGTCLFLELLSVPESKAIKATAIATTIIGFFSSVAAIIGNAVVLVVLKKSERLQTPSNILIGFLCISDFLTGVIVTPFSAYRRLHEAFQGHPCLMRLICAYFAFFCLSTSLVTVGEISIDRYFAIMMPFKYQRSATNAKYIVIVSISWLLLGILALLPFIRVITAMVFFRVLFGLMGVIIITFLVTYARIFLVVKSHRRKICSVRHTSITAPESHTNERAMVIREGRKANTIAILMTFALVSYVPLAVMFILRGTLGDTIELVTIADPWADLFLQVNSSINPFIYCFRTKEIRDGILRILPETLRPFVSRIFCFRLLTRSREVSNFSVTLK